MDFWNKLLKAEQNIRKKVENVFGNGTAQTPLEIRRGILEQVESRIVVDTGGRVFPFAKIVVQLQPPTEALRDVFETAFIQDGSLRADILGKLKDSEARYPAEIEIAIELQQIPSVPSPVSPSLFQLDFVKADPLRKPEIPEMKLVTVKGAAEAPEFLFKKERILVGRLSEVLDREGRMVRKNDVVFLDNGDDVNSTVGRAHARIWFDLDRREFCIMDEASRYGTRIIREGRYIEIPAGNTRGIRLRTGDEIYLGQACIRFELINRG
jgi:hypothetical protein